MFFLHILFIIYLSDYSLLKSRNAPLREHSTGFGTQRFVFCICNKECLFYLYGNFLFSDYEKKITTMISNLEQKRPQRQV